MLRRDAALGWGLCSLAAAVLAVACSSGGDSAGTVAPEPVPVAVATAARRDVPLALRGIGRVQAFSTVIVKAQVGGQLSQIQFREGQEVDTGALLFVIDPRPYEAARREAEAKLAQDTAEARNAAVEATRFARLVGEGVVSHDEHERASTRAAALEALLAADEAALEVAGLRVQYCYIRSPIRGRIGQILVHEGNVVKENETTLAVVNQVQPIQVEFSLPQTDLPAVREHMPTGPLATTVTIPGADPRPITGVLTFVDNTVDSTTGTVRLKADFPNQDEMLWPGQFVTVSLQLTTRRDVIVVPARAVQTGQAGRFVYVVTPANTVEMRPVELGLTAGDEVVIAQGVEAGEQVVTDGQLRLAPGMPVRAREGSEGTT